MNDEILKKLTEIVDNFNIENFIYDFLLAYGISKSVVSRLKKGDQNRSTRQNEVLYAKKIIFRTENSDNLFNAIDDIHKDTLVQKHNPRFAVMTDCVQLVAKDLKLGKTLDIPLKELPKYFDFFLPLAGSEVYHSANDNEADRNATYKMATLYDKLIEANPDIYQSKEHIHQLNVFLSRLLFCFFAEDTGIFSEDSIFTNTLVQHTQKNGQDTHLFLDKLFNRLNSNDVTGLPDFLTKFPYVNGGLFKDDISSPIFSSEAYKILIELGELQWKNINPDIFGSMIQAVTTGVDRSKLGQHYTSVPNILKLIKPLFIDEFYEELEKATTITQLYKLQNRIANAKFFDPACGSGNFLIITYKELRVLEIEIIKKIIELSADKLTLNTFASQISISKFYGIEIDDFAHEIAILSLWLAEHQMNIIFEERLFGYAEVASILPLKSIGNIEQGNATRVKWETVCPILDNDEVYVIGNPPYLGARYQTDEHRKQIKEVLSHYDNYKRLDYIVCWFHKASDYIKSKNAKFAFVSTNSITQGEQVTPIWSQIFEKNLEIDFAYRSFKWKNNAKGNAGVTVVIIGIRNQSNKEKYIFENNTKIIAKNINGYLAEEKNFNISSRSTPLSKLQPMTRTNPALDDGHLLLDEDLREKLIKKYPKIGSIIKPVIGAHEFLQGKKKFCLWITDEYLELANSIPEVKDRIEQVRLYRLSKNNRPKNDPADFPHRFLKMKLAEDSVLFLPTVSSERREYIPCGLFDNNTVIIDPNFAIYEPTPVSFAILSSKMHMVWVKKFSGKLKTDFRYSSTLCYNTFPFPEINKKQEELLAQYVFDVLEARANHLGKTLAWMYDPDTMPSDLKEAHQALDEAIERCYRLQPFSSDAERLEYLFKLYEKMIANENSKA